MEVKEGIATMSDESVLSKTGKNWTQWFELLDEWGGVEKGHKLMAKWLAEEHGVSAWWSQTITVAFERARGLREVNERAKGFAVSVTRTVAADLDRCWYAWAEASELSKWFTTSAEQDFREGGRYRNADQDSGTFLRIVPKNRVRFTWEQELHQAGSEVEVTFQTLPTGKTRICLTHEKLSSQKEVADLREGWSWAMDSLKSYLESGKPISWKDWKAKKEG
jgi:uncharacterized protein YndB with AHSA1/START domain